MSKNNRRKRRKIGWPLKERTLLFVTKRMVLWNGKIPCIDNLKCKRFGLKIIKPHES